MGQTRDTSHGLRSGLSAGERIIVRDEPWRIVGTSPHVDCESLRLLGRGDRNRDRERTILYPFDRPRREKLRGRLATVSPHRWLDRLIELDQLTVTWPSVWSASSARIDIHPYQLEPALAILDGRASRLLLADEVGLGKTIQAGLIVSELIMRGWASRVLVLAPHALAPQWQVEFRRRFGIDARCVDAWHLQQRRSSLPPGANPWSSAGVSIVSLDFAKRLENRRSLEGTIWDALVVDEAHRATVSSDRGAAVAALASRSRYVLLLSATPHDGDPRAFDHLVRIGHCETASSDRLLAFRRNRRDVGLPARRPARMLSVRLSRPERRMHRLLQRYTRQVLTSAGARRQADVRLAMVVLTKRALSSASSLQRSVERRLSWLRAEPVDPAQLTLWPEADPEADEEPCGVLRTPGHDDPAWECTALDEIRVAAAVAARRESKRDRLQRLLARTIDPVIIFTEYRDTALQLAEALRNCGEVVVLHGALPLSERRMALRRFETGRTRLLIATDVAGEGLNLQYRCRWVINYELPWNPIRLEQRVGRVDRVGQTRPVHALHLIARDTAETAVLGRLVAKLDRIRLTLGSVDHILGRLDLGRLEETVVLGETEAVRPFEVETDTGSHRIQSKHREVEWADPGSASDRLATEVVRVTRQRTALGKRSRDDRNQARPQPSLRDDAVSSPAVTRLPPIAVCAAGTVIVAHATMLAAGGGPVGTRLVCVLVRPDRGTGSRHDDRSFVRSVISDVLPAVQIRAQAVADAATGEREAYLAFVCRATDREHALLRDLSRHEGVVQPELFDRRALRRVSTERELIRALADECRGRLVRLERARQEGWQVQCAVVLVGTVSGRPGLKARPDGTTRQDHP